MKPYYQDDYSLILGLYRVLMFFISLPFSMILIPISALQLIGGKKKDFAYDVIMNKILLIKCVEDTTQKTFLECSAYYTSLDISRYDKHLYIHNDTYMVFPSWIKKNKS